MIDDRINDSYLSAEVAQVPESVSHRMMSHYCMDIQDQAPPRPSTLSLRFESSSNNYVDLKSHQMPRGYHSIKRTDSMDRDKVIGQLENNGSTPMTPTSFLNPKEITAEQEQFAEYVQCVIISCYASCLSYHVIMLNSFLWLSLRAHLVVYKFSPRFSMFC